MVGFHVEKWKAYSELSMKGQLSVFFLAVEKMASFCGVWDTPDWKLSYLLNIVGIRIPLLLLF